MRTDVKSKLCLRCRWKLEGVPSCEAFPRQIPKAIASGKVAHKKPFDGDHGIQYQPKSKRE